MNIIMKSDIIKLDITVIKSVAIFGICSAKVSLRTSFIMQS